MELDINKGWLIEKFCLGIHPQSLRDVSWQSYPIEIYIIPQIKIHLRHEKSFIITGIAINFHLSYIQHS